MKITNDTPLQVGPFASRHPDSGRPAMTVVVKGTFRLVNDGTCVLHDGPIPFTGDVYRDDDPEGECLIASDFAPWKPAADLLLSGTGHAPGGEPVGVLPVRFAVGGWSRTLALFGPRSWESGAQSPGLSRPFTSLALGWKESFGGPGWAANPVGVGYGGELLPRIEDDRQQLRQRGDTPPPAGFGPLNRNWALRRKKVGTYGGDYLKSRWPGFPVDFDWRHFNAAPEEQQVPYLTGDETIELENLHPESPRIASRLPGLRVRCLVRYVGRDGVSLSEPPMALDTLAVDADRQILTLAWRGLVQVADEDLTDVLEIFVATETVGSPPPHWKELEQRMSPTAPLLASALALQPRTAGATVAAAGATPPAAVTPGAAAPPAAAAPDAAAPPAADPDAPLPPAPPPGTRPADDLANFFRRHGADLQKSLEQVDQAEAELRELVRRNPAACPWPGWPDAPAPPAEEIQARIQDTWQKQLAEGYQPSEDLQKLMTDARPFEALKIAQVMSQLLAKPPVNPETPPVTVADIRNRLARGESLSGQDLGAADLSGQDLSGSNLTLTLLRGGQLAGARLDGAALLGATLANGNLAGASLKNCDLRQADLTDCDLTNADLRGARLEWALLGGAQLAGARLDAAQAAHATFARADLTGARLDGADLRSASFAGATLDGARFTGATLAQAQLAGATGRGTDFTKADLSGIQAGESVVLTGGTFVDANAPGGIWEGARLDDSDFSRAELCGSLFERASLPRCRFDGAGLAGARFRKASLVQSTFLGADLLRSSMARADLTGADFGKANLFEAEFFEATLQDTLFAGANLKRTTVESR